MPVPSNRIPVRVARAIKSVLTANLASLKEGEVVYAKDENMLYVVEGGALVSTGAQSIDQLTDVDTSSAAPTAGQALVWDSGTSQWKPGAAGATTIDQLTDVNTSSSAPTNGQVLTWDSAASQWKPATGGAATLDSIGDVNVAAIQAASDGRALIYQNGEWVAGPVIGGVSYTPTGGDPYYNNVKLLLHMDGADNGTTFADSSSFSTAIVKNGTGVTSTAQVKAGTASYKPGTGAGDYISITGGLNLTGDFTIEFHAHPLADLGNLLQFGGSANRLQLNQNTAAETGTNAYKAYARINNLELIDNVAFGFTKDAWNYVALTRSGTTLRLFNNGILYATGTQALTGTVVLAGLAGSYNGYIDEFRVTDGVARYTASYTGSIPSVPFPNLSSSPVTIPYSIDKHSDVDTSTSAPTSGQVLAWDGTNWVPATRLKSDTTQAGANSVAVQNVVKITQANYDALASKDANTVYFII